METGSRSLIGEANGALGGRRERRGLLFTPVIAFPEAVVQLCVRRSSCIVTTPRRQPHILLLLAASFVMFTGSYVLDQAFRWSDPLQGIINGAFHTIFTGIAWLIYGLLPGLLIYGLYRWRHWQRFRSVAIVFPGIAALVAAIAGLILSPTTPARRLKQFTGADFPASARDLRTHFTGGGVADFGDTYYFRCSPADTDALIRTLGLKPTDRYDQHFFSERPFPSWPDPSTWAGSMLYRGGKDDGGWSYYLRTDAAREQVYLLIACT